MRGSLLAAVAVVSALFAPSAFAAREASPCSHVTRSEVGSTLGIAVKSTRSVPEPGVLGFTVCFFATTTNPVALSVGFQTQTGKQTYAADVGQTGNLAKTVSGLGRQGLLQLVVSGRQHVPERPEGKRARLVRHSLGACEGGEAGAEGDREGLTRVSRAARSSRSLHRDGIPAAGRNGRAPAPGRSPHSALPYRRP